MKIGFDESVEETGLIKKHKWGTGIFIEKTVANICCCLTYEYLTNWWL
jgi:hypothetical protein